MNPPPEAVAAALAAVHARHDDAEEFRKDVEEDRDVMLLDTIAALTAAQPFLAASMPDQPKETPVTDWYDQHEDMIPALIRNSRWSCLDCPEPSGEPWESTTDHCPAAVDHHYATGHRVNGAIEVRHRAQKLDVLVAGRDAEPKRRLLTGTPGWERRDGATVDLAQYADDPDYAAKIDARGGWPCHSRRHAMTEPAAVPDAAVAVIAEALHRQQCHSALCTTGPSKQDFAKAREALAEVAPHFAAAELTRLGEDIEAGDQVADRLRDACAKAERERIVKWLYAEAHELAHGKPGLTEQQRMTRRQNSSALMTAIAHMSAHGLLDGLLDGDPDGK